MDKTQQAIEALKRMYGEGACASGPDYGLGSDYDSEADYQMVLQTLEQTQWQSVRNLPNLKMVILFYHDENVEDECGEDVWGVGYRYSKDTKYEGWCGWDYSHPPTHYCHLPPQPEKDT